MTQKKATLVWDDKKHPVVENGINNRPKDESQTEYIRKCIEHYEASDSVLEYLIVIKNMLKSGMVVASVEEDVQNQEQEDLFDDLLEQMEQ